MSREEWHADIEITEELVKNCLQEQFPDLMTIKNIQLLGEGWDNKVFLINDNIVFRFPRRKVAIELMEQENQLLKNLPAFNVNIPVLNYIGRPNKYYPYAFHGYNLITGTPGYAAQLTDADRMNSLKTMALFLKQLHSIDEQQALAMGAQSQVFDRTEITKAIQNLRERTDKIIARQLVKINQTMLQQEFNAVQQLILPKQKCLIHGDLDSRHLLFKEQELVGIIDWGDAGINNKAADLSIIWSFYPADCHQAFFSIYGTIDIATWQYARFLGLYSTLTLMLYGHDTGNRLLVAESVQAVQRIGKDLLQ